MPRGVNMYDEGRIQQRNFAASDNIQIISPGVVTDGLVLHLDAGNYASYPASGTIWRDLSSRRNNGTLTNGPTFNANNGGAIVFDGSNDNVTTGSYNYGDTFTISAFLYPLYKFDISNICANSNTGGATNGFRLLINDFQTDNQNLRFQYGNGTNFDTIADPGRIVWSAWQHVTFVVDKNAVICQIYYNGELTVSSALSFTNFNTNAQIFIGTYANLVSSGGAFNYYGRIPFFLIYNRALSPQEVAQNFNATRTRFGI